MELEDQPLKRTLSEPIVIRGAYEHPNWDEAYVNASAGLFSEGLPKIHDFF
jgi:hypothetical protein